MKTFNQEKKDHWIKTMKDLRLPLVRRLITQLPWRREQLKYYRTIGCFYDGAMHTDTDALEKAIEAMHLPAWLIHLAKEIFEGLPIKDAVKFLVQLLEVIPVDTDIEAIRQDLAMLRLTDSVDARLGINSTDALADAESAAECAALADAELAGWTVSKWSERRARAAGRARSARVETVWKKERDNLFKSLKALKPPKNKMSGETKFELFIFAQLLGCIGLIVFDIDWPWWYMFLPLAVLVAFYVLVQLLLYVFALKKK